MSDTPLTLDEVLNLTESLANVLSEEKNFIRKCNFQAMNESRIVRDTLTEQYFAAIQLLQLKPEIVENGGPAIRERIKRATITLSEAMNAHKRALNSQIKAHERFLELCAEATKNKVATTYTPRGQQSFQKDAAVYSQSTYAINAQF